MIRTQDPGLAYPSTRPLYDHHRVCVCVCVRVRVRVRVRACVCVLFSI